MPLSVESQCLLEILLYCLLVNHWLLHPQSVHVHILSGLEASNSKPGYAHSIKHGDRVGTATIRPTINGGRVHYATQHPIECVSKIAHIG